MNLNKVDSISFDVINSYLSNFVKSLPDYDKKWKDFYVGGAGQTVVDVGSAITAFLAYAAQANRKNSTLQENFVKSEAVAIGAALGYYYNRKSCARLELTIEAPSSVFWSRENPFGSYGKNNLVLLEDTQIEAGTNKLVVALGDWNYQTKTVTDTSEFLSLYFEGDIDNKFYEFRVNDELVPLVKFISKSSQDSILVRSTVDGIYTVFGNGLIGRLPKFEDELRLDFITPADLLPEGTLSGEDLQPNFGVITSYKLIDYGSNPDSLEKVKAVAPGFYYSNGLLTSIADYSRIADTYEGIISTAAKRKSNTCCAVDVAYLREDEQLMTPAMREEFYDYLVEFSVIGTTPFIHDPEKIEVDFQLVAVLQRGADRTLIESQIREAIESQCMILKHLFKPNKLTSKDFVCKIDGLDSIYIQYPIKDKQANFNEYFKLRHLDIQFTQDVDSVHSNGTDLSLGYYKNGEKY